ncbi:MAG: hypothetical protein KC731_12405 [Myxococcales bacterium]|nr:hypothetical protein [Myxococcales bacterium]
MRAEVALSLLLLVGCVGDRGAAPADSANPASSTPAPETPAAQGELLYALSYVPGAAWKDGEPLAAQGLDDHFGYVGDLFERRILVANGLYSDELRGLYLLSVGTEEEVRAITASDPAVTQGKLRVDTIEPWLVVLQAFDASIGDAELFVLRYLPGASWVEGKPLAEQDLSAHLAYVGQVFERGQLLAGGPLVDRDEGRYIVAVKSRAETDALVAADPAVQAELFEVTIHPWTAAQRQAPP